MRKNILIADDEESIRYTFTSFLSEAGYRLTTVGSLPDCLKKMRAESFDLLFLDIGIGRDNGLEAIPEIQEIQPDCSVVIMTGVPSAKTITQARKYGALDYLTKPVRQTSLLYIARKTLASKVAVNQ